MRPQSTRELAETARRLLKKQAKVEPRVRFQKMVDSGLIDAEGRLTKNFGGDAEPAPTARHNGQR